MRFSYVLVSISFNLMFKEHIFFFFPKNKMAFINFHLQLTLTPKCVDLQHTLVSFSFQSTMITFGSLSINLCKIFSCLTCCTSYGFVKLKNKNIKPLHILSIYCFIFKKCCVHFKKAKFQYDFIGKFNVKLLLKLNFI